MQDQLTKLEKSVLEQFVSGDNTDAKRLRVQIAKLKFESREYNDVGFKTSFSLPLNVPALSDDFDENQPNIFAEHPQAPAGAGFLLHIENRKVKSLNGYVFVGRWPRDESKFRVSKHNYPLINPQVKQAK